MQIRPATTADVDAIMQLVTKLVPLMQAAGNFQWDDNYPNPAVFYEDIDKEQLWVSEIDGAIAGVTAITMDQDPEYADVGWDITEPAIVTHRLAVDPSFQGKGVAKALLQQAETIANNRGIKVLRIDTGSNNEVTQALFPKMGYTFAGEIGLKFRPGIRVFCYEKRL